MGCRDENNGVTKGEETNWDPLYDGAMHLSISPLFDTT